jgi:hypothetical protein
MAMFCEPKEKRREKKELIGIPVIYRARMVGEPRNVGVTKSRRNQLEASP